MRVLMTTDAVGGVWQYSLALARGLVERWGCRIALVCLGDPPGEELGEALPSGGVELVTLPLKLEWMPEAEGDVARGLEQMEGLIDRWRPELVHSNQFCFGMLRPRLPRVVVAHSDVLSWIAWHRGGGASPVPIAPQADRGDGLAAYRRLVSSGLSGASAVVCPSRFTARSLLEVYGLSSRVIYNGLWEDLYQSRPKEDVAILAGRLWDEAKGAATAVAAVEGLPLDLQLLGPTVGPSGETALLPDAPNVRYRGSCSWRETRETMSRSRYYLATSSYEPFGLAALEAALSGCALLAAGTPSYREVWDDAALYYRPGDAADLREKLAGLIQAPEEAHRLGLAAQQRALARYTAARMADDYYELYERLSADS
ncbi:MAG: glycosyltransferase family 4 protein [Chloroflexota bacterium]